MPDIFIAFIPVLLFLAFLFPAVAVILLLKLLDKLDKPKERKSYKQIIEPKVIECTSIVKLVDDEQSKQRNITIL